MKYLKFLKIMIIIQYKNKYRILEYFKIENLTIT